MDVKMILKTLYRTFEIRKVLMFALVAFMCAMISVLYVKIGGIDSSIFALMALCGGLAWKYNLTIPFSLWIIQAMVVAYFNGVSAENEYKIYKYVALRYKRRYSWLAFEVCSTILRSVGFSALLLAIGISVCKLNGMQNCISFSSFLSEAETGELYKNEISYVVKLFVVTTLRFSNIGLVVLTSHILPKHGTQAGFMVVLMNEVIAFFNTTKQIPAFTFYTASQMGWSFSAIIIISTLGLATLIGLYSVIFSVAVRKAMV